MARVSDDKFWNKDIRLGDHVASIYQNKEQQFEVLMPFFIEGLKLNQKCVYVYDENTKEEIISEFEKAGIEINLYLKSGQLELFESREMYLDEGKFQPEKMLEKIEAMEKRAFEEGFWGLRGSGEMGISLEGKVDEIELIDYESRINEFLVGRKITLICQYNENKVSHKILNNVIRTHPFVIVYGKIYENKYFYTAPEYMERGSHYLPEEEYKTIIDTIITE
ncbi:MAG TPA: MEDS domain-containing protein [Candidatus Methanoperedens sp.]|nr:MEDS domain-containing protein [Candidatus Methanoperedens sp.]